MKQLQVAETQRAEEGKRKERWSQEEGGSSGGVSRGEDGGFGEGCHQGSSAPKGSRGGTKIIFSRQAGNCFQEKVVLVCWPSHSTH